MSPLPKETTRVHLTLWEAPGAISMSSFQCPVTSLEKHNLERISESYPTSKKVQCKGGKNPQLERLLLNT